MLSPKVPLTPAVQRGLMQFQSPDLKRAENSDTMFTKGSLRAAYRAAGAVLAAVSKYAHRQMQVNLSHAWFPQSQVDGVLSGRHRRAFCAIRPPGHHAGSLGLLSDAVSCGFCIFNNVCVGALHALRRDPQARVAIVDFDVHHGNGSEEIVRSVLGNSLPFVTGFPCETCKLVLKFTYAECCAGKPLARAIQLGASCARGLWTRGCAPTASSMVRLDPPVSLL